MDTNIVNIIQSRLEIMGMSQAQFAECVSATPSQIGIFLKEKGSLTTESLNKGLDLVGVNLSMYSSRNALAKEIATLLASKNVSSIDNWSKTDLAMFSQRKEILLFFDVETEEQYLNMAKSGLIDIESTFPFFKALISYYMKLDGVKPTASKAKQALTNLMGNSNSTSEHNVSNITEKFATGVAIGALVVASPILGSILSAASLAASKQIGAFSLFAKSNSESLFAKGLDFFKNK